MLQVLLLEDSKLDAQIVAAELEERRCELTRVESRAAFRAALDSCSYDLILSDYRVPGFGGDEALVVARDQCPDIPFIFVSGALGEETAIDLLKRGATDYVLKDRLERLVPSVDRALREAREKAERQRAEQLLREREQTLSTLMSNLPGMAFRRDLERPWRLRFASRGCHALTGSEPEALYDCEQGWERFMHPLDVARFEEEARSAYAAGVQLTSTYRILTPSGQERWVWERSAAMATPERGSQSVEGFATDITQQKAAEAEVSRRIEFEQQLIGIVSHDLRNPLNAITLGAARLIKQDGLQEATTRSVRRILASAERAARMIRDLLDFTQARLGGGIPLVPQLVDVAELLGQVVEEFEHAHPERKLDLVCSGPLLARCDADRIVQALTNLAGNAITYSAPGTAIGLHGHLAAGDVLLEVHNLGEPIPEERMLELFKPLSRGVKTVDLQTRSIGLGLFIVDSIARAHGGGVTVRSNAEEGTTFVLRIPQQLERNLSDDEA
ncbi:MAG: sensor signal transduction histidine kinase [Myxococcaceae bacterium]|nr:sensor signal transduction histidine kinase [Myxococcaceae bacterium]